MTEPQAARGSDTLCSDCPPVGYPTDETRCAPCPRQSLATAIAEIVRLNGALDMITAEREAWKFQASKSDERRAEAMAIIEAVRNVATVWRTEAQRSTQTESCYTVRGQACREAADVIFAALSGNDGDSQRGGWLWNRHGLK